jgi:acyl-homoserine-lactone acylase
MAMLRRIPWKWVLILVAVTVIVAAGYVFWPESVDLSDLADVGAKYDVRILRDTWGVPHVFGQTDADAAYGLAYAHAEDDFLTIQQSLLAARGLLATVYGRDAAPNDYMVHLLRIWDVIEARYESDLSPETRAIVEAYADGLNHYAALHPKDVLSAEIFPVTGQDVVAGSVHKSPLFFGLDGMLSDLFEDERQSDISRRPSAHRPSWSAGLGSNTFAVGPSRSADGATFLAVNSHQPWEGPVTWYEAHVHSEDGWDMAGALFPGVPAIVLGHNRHLGWGFTVNHPDLTDVYVLDINPDDPYQYRFDGEWLELERRTAPIKVKLLGRLKWTFNQEVLWSVYGPVIQRDHGTYAVRYAGYGRVDIYEQLYRMNKATDFDSWLAAVRDGGLPMFNIGYADGEGNITYLYGGLLPVRAEGYDWSLYLPGDTSETLWTDYLPFDRLPQVLNPAAGFVQNANSTPFQTTLGADNPSPDDYSVTLGIETDMTNRALRALELFGADESITFEEFIAYKYDMAYSDKSDVARFRQMLLDGPTPTDPELQAALEVLRAWDLRTDPDNRGAALMILTLHYLYEGDADIDPSRLVGGEVTRTELMDAFAQAVRTLMDKHGRLDVPWSQVNRLRRGDVDLGLGGGPEVLHAVYGELGEDGRFKGFVGDSFVQLVAWDAEGQVRSFSVHQYGSATLDANSPHYADQSPLFVKRQLKPVSFDEADIRTHLEREYRPGEELTPDNAP